MTLPFRLRHIAPLALLLALLTCWPYYYCARQTPPGWHFLGLVCDAVDQHTYLSFMERARAGQFFLDNLYTGEVEKPLYWNFYWWLLGIFARLTGFSLIAVYQGSRIVFSLVLLVLLARLIAYFLPKNLERWCAFALLSLGTGFGWLLVMFLPIDKAASNSLDLSVPEAFTFLSILWKPHFVFAVCLQVGVLWLFYAACEKRSWGLAFGAASLALLLGCTHAFHLTTIYFVTVTFALLWSRRAPATATVIERWQPLGYALLLISVSSPALLYLSYIVRLSPMMQAWRAQNICLSPPLWSYLLGFGPVLWPLFCFPREVMRLQAASSRNLFLLTWAVCNSLLLYTGGHLPFERRLAQGLQIPLTLLATQVFFQAAYPRLTQWKPIAGAMDKGVLSRATFSATMSMLWLLSALGTSLYHLTTTSFGPLPPQSPGLFYVTSDESAAAAYLKFHAAPNAVILAPELQSAWLPVLDARRVFAGHPMQTSDAAHKYPLMMEFFKGQMSRIQRDRLLRDSRIDYVFWPKSRALAPPAELVCRRVFDSPQVTLFRVESKS